MNKHVLAPEGIAMLESDDHTRKTIVRALKETLGVKVLGFDTPEMAADYFEPEKIIHEIEPCVLITDQLSLDPPIKFLPTFRPKYRRMKVILYSASDEKVATLKKDGLIDDFVQKATDEDLVSHAIKCLEKYREELDLQELRRYIETKCRSPETPFYSDGEGDYLSIIELYWEMVRDTPLGQELRHSWRGFHWDELPLKS